MLTLERVYELVTKQLGAKVLESNELGPESGMDDLGLSSLQVSDIIFSIEEELGIEFDLVEAAEVKTIGQLVDLANSNP